MNSFHDKKRFLMQYRNQQAEIRSIEEELATLRMKKMHPSLSIDGMPGGAGASDLSSYAAAVDKIERRLLRQKKRLLKTMYQIEQAIGSLEDSRQRSILKDRYILGLSWAKIAERQFLEERQVYRIHGDALYNIQIPKEF